jgi:hypothetical protein
MLSSRIMIGHERPIKKSNQSICKYALTALDDGLRSAGIDKLKTDECWSPVQAGAHQ